MQTLLAFVVVIGVLVTAHEFGHYLAARACGVRVLRFSVGFGRILWSRRRGVESTEWAIAVFPLGGYVKMLDEREGEVALHERHQAFNRQSVAKRSLIVAAGPLANFVVAILLYWVLFMHGTPELRPILAAPTAATAAHAAGIQAAERVISVNGEEIKTWEELRWVILERHQTSEFRLELVNARNEIAFRTLQVDTSGDSRLASDALLQLGLRPHRPDLPAIIGEVTASSPAAAAGLRAGDQIMAIDGVTVDGWRAVVETVRGAPERLLEMAVSRDGQVLVISITPNATELDGTIVGRIGASVRTPPGGDAQDVFVEIAYGPSEAAARAVRETYEKSLFTLQMFGRMITGEVSWKNLSGPVTIADYAGQSARAGWTYFLRFMALVSISLGVLNLLPVPLLDGGHLMYHLIEVIKRGPLSERAQEIGQQIGLSALVLLMAFAFYNDLQRLLAG